MKMLLPQIVVLATMCDIMHNFQKKFGIVLVLAIVLVAVGWACFPSLLGLLADHYYAQANQAGDAEVSDLIDRLASLGPPAIPRLTAALGSERKVVAQTVRARLIKMIEDWEHPDTRPAPEIRLDLARSLALRMEQYGPTARLHAVTLARQMLRASTSGMNKRELQQFTIACEMILSLSKAITKKERELLEEEKIFSASSDGSLARQPAEETPSDPGVFHTVSSPQNMGNVPLSSQPLVDLARLPGGALPPALPALNSRKLTPEEGGGRATTPLLRSTAKSKEPQAQGAYSLGEEGLENPSRREPGTLADSPSDENPIRGTDPNLRRLPDDPSVRPLQSDMEGTEAKTLPRYGAFSPTEKPSDRVYLLIMQLHAGDPKKAEQARRELTEGGFKTVHFALAERMADPDPAVRKELARVLPRLKSVQAKQWLKWLLKDDDAGVRREALSTLASSGDPTLLAEVAEIAQSDPDPQIRLEGQQIESRLAK